MIRTDMLRSVRFWLVIALVIVSGIFVFERYRDIYRIEPTPDEMRQKQIKEAIGHVPAASKVRFEKILAKNLAHLLDGFQSEIFQTRLLPTQIREFYGIGKTGMSSDMADPGEDFQVSDVIVKDLPARRLVFAAVRESDQHWMIEFEFGGRGHGWILQVMRLEENHILPVGACYLEHPYGNIALLSAALRHGDCTMWLYDYYDPDQPLKKDKPRRM